MNRTVAVVGGGIIGASIAWRLAERGVKVTVIDAGELGGEASWAGAGMLAPGAEVTEVSIWQALALESLREYADYVGQLTEQSGVAIDYRPHGAIELALTDEEWVALRERSERQTMFGIRSETLSAEAARERIKALNAPGLKGALWYPGDALVDPRDIMKALRVTLQKLSVEILERSTVEAILIDAEGVEVTGPEVELRATDAVLAAGAWASRIEVTFGGEPVGLTRAYPVRGHLTRYAAEPGVLGPILRHHHTYLLQRTNGTLIAGTSQEEVGFDRTVDPRIEADIRSRAEALIPGLVKGQPSETWIGFRPAADGLEPVLGQVAGQPLWLAYGNYRNGILMAPATADLIVSQMVG